MSENKELRHEVVVHLWEESERGWGVKLNGFSIHLNVEDCISFIKDYWDRMPDWVPEVYSRPAKYPYNSTVSQETYEKLLESKNGLRFYSNNYPEMGGYIV